MNQTFDILVTQIAEADRAASSAAGRQAQQLLSLRSWLIGAWIVAFEQHGADRAAYGDRLIERLAEALKSTGRKGLSARNLLNCRQVAISYPVLDVAALPSRPLMALPEIPQTSAESSTPIPPTSAESPSPASNAPDLPWRDSAWLRRLFTELSFSHLL
jgi:hypothetical protein